MRAAMVIGLGGTGCKVIDKLEKVVQWRDNKDINRLSNFAGLSLDTAKESMDTANSFIHMGVHANAAAGVLAMPEENRRWLSEALIGEITDGAGAVRMQGKYAFFMNYKTIKSAIIGKLDELQNKLNSNDELLIFVIANSVSGTGSGAFVDLGFLVRQVLKEDASTRAHSTKIILMLTMPVDKEQTQHYPNSYYALSELDHYMSGNEYIIDNILNSGEEIRMRYTGSEPLKPFDFVYLVGNRNTGGAPTDAQVDQLISEYIYCELFSSTGERAGARRDDFNKYLREKDLSGLATCYSTFGLAILEYPASRIAQLASVIYAQRALGNWTEKNADPPHFAPERIYLGGRDEHFINRLLKAIRVTQHGGAPVLLDISDTFTREKERAYMNFDADYDVNTLRKLCNDIKSAFKELPHDTMVVKGGEIIPGLVPYVISRNVMQLAETWFSAEMARGQEADGICASVLRYMFDNKDGIALAKNVLDNIVSQLEMLSGMTLDVRDPDIDNILDNINMIKKPLLLAPFHKTMITQEMDAFKKELDRYIWDKQCSLAYASCKHLLATVIKAVEKMRKKINEFGIKVETAKAALQGTYTTMCSPYGVNGHVVSGTQIPERAEIVADNVTGSFPPESFIRTDFRILCEPGLLSIKETFPAFKTDVILSLLRDVCLSNLGSSGVVEEFRAELEEDEDKNLHGKLQELCNHTSKLSMDIKDKDPTSQVFKQGSADSKFFRCFYRHGDQANSANDAEDSSNWLTHELKRNGLIKGSEWGKVNQGLDSDNVVIFLKERGGYPLHFWNDLEYTNWQEALRFIEETPDDGDTPRFLSRADMDFAGFMPTDIRRVAAAKSVFWRAVATGAVDPINDFNFRLVGTGGRDQKTIPREYQSAVRKLAANRVLLKDVTGILDGRMRSLGTGAFLASLRTLMDGNTPITVKGVNEKVKKEMVWVLENWIREDEDYCKAWNNAYPNDFVGNTVDDVLYTLDEKNAPADNTKAHGYYCAACDAYICELYHGPEKAMKFLDNHNC
jgi:hypothetical protein